MDSISPRRLRSFPQKIQNLLLYGEPDERTGSAQDRFPRHARLSQAGLEESTSETYREWLLDYMSATTCPVCQGKRLRPESLAVKVNGMSIADFTALPVSRALETVAQDQA